MDVTVDQCFTEVARECADPSRPHGWITQGILDAYENLHRLGWAHSVETWLDGQLVGGLYGVSIGSFFAGESMFYRSTDASKVALVHLARSMAKTPGALLDVQWSTQHLQSLGTIEIPREDYLVALAQAIEHPSLVLTRKTTH
jgi:leucyl/phenylalanyl-tRNA--protein transferase